MSPGAPQILIVDDKEQAGLDIAKALWDGDLAAHYFHYDPERLIQMQQRGRSMRGIRIVFMDINLIGGAMGSEQQNFTAVQTVLQTLLAEDNGPYVLISWSSHDDYADRLFAFLAERLPPTLRPTLTKRLAKSEFAGASGKNISAAVKGLLNDLGFAGCLIGWEGVVKDATVSAIHAVARLADTLTDHEVHSDRNTKLGAVIRALATAEAEENLTEQSAFPALSSVLSHIMFDGLSSAAARVPAALGKSIMTAAGSTQPKDWKFDVHRALHFGLDPQRYVMHAPGDVFIFPGIRKRKRAGLPILKPDAFVPNQFFEADKWRKLPPDARKTVLGDARLVMAEITPPCDHAHPATKLVWHRYVVGGEFGPDASKYLKKKGDHLMWLPAFKTKDGKTKTVVLNSRVTASVDPKETGVLGKRLYRLRPQLLSDIIRWVSGQHARLGYVSLS